MLYFYFRHALWSSDLFQVGGGPEFCEVGSASRVFDRSVGGGHDFLRLTFMVSSRFPQVDMHFGVQICLSWQWARILLSCQCVKSF